MPDGNKNNIFQKFENITGRIQDASLVLGYEFFKNGFCGRKKIKKNNGIFEGDSVYGVSHCKM